MDFEQIIDDIKDYIQTNLPLKLQEIEAQKPDVALGVPDLYVIDYPDTERQQKVVVFINPTEWEFSPLTNQSDELKNDISIFITFKGDAPTMMKKVLRYMEALHAILVDDETLGGAVDMSVITSARSWKSIEASATTKAIEVILVVRKETTN